MCAAVITHGYSPPILDPAKHDLNLMPLFIQIFIVRDGPLSVLSGRDARRNTEVVPIVWTVSSGFLACLFPHHAAFNSPSW